MEAGNKEKGREDEYSRKRIMSGKENVNDMKKIRKIEK